MGAEIRGLSLGGAILLDKDSEGMVIVTLAVQ